MEEKNKSELLQFVAFVLQFKKIIFGFVAMVSIAAAIFSAPNFMPPLYKSEAVFYPPNTNSNKILIQNDSRFGVEKEIDEHIQLLKSGLVRDSIIKKYNLIQHYEIDTAVKIWRYQLYKLFDERINIDRNRYNALSAGVLDTDPQIASNIANDLVTVGDAVKAGILRKNLNAALGYLEKDYNKKVTEFNALADNVNRLARNNKLPNLNLKSQSFVERMKEQINLISELSSANNNGYDLKQQYNYESILSQLAEVQSSYEQASSNLNNNYPTCYVVSPAQASYKKVSPNRTLIVVVAAISAFLFSVLMLLLIQKAKQLKHELEQN